MTDNGIKVEVKAVSTILPYNHHVLIQYVIL